MTFTEPIEDFFRSVKDRLSEQQIFGFVSVLIAGLVAHGYIIFNRISYHDNSACLFNLGGTYESGRWMLGFIYDIQMKTTKLFSVPVFNGILSVLFIAIAAMVLIEMFDVQSKFLSAAIGAIMVVYPVVTSIFSFMFTSWEYQLALLLAILSVKVLTEDSDRKFVFTLLISVALCTVSLGIYQAYFSVTIALFLIKLFFKLLDDDFAGVLDYVKTGLTYLLQLGISLVLWAILRKVTMLVKGITAVDYKGMDEGYDISKFPQVFLGLFKAFFGFGQEGINAVLYQRAFTALIFVITLVQIAYLISQYSGQISMKLISLVGLIFLPIGMNVVYLLSTSSEYNVDSLMLYGDIFIYILPLLLIERMEAAGGVSWYDAIPGKLMFVATWIQIVSITVMTLGYVYMDNAAYLKAELAQEQAVAYYNQLITAIKSCDGFSEDMEIVMVGWSEVEDGTFVNVDTVDQLEAVKIDKFPRYTDLVRYSGSIHFMREHLGFGNDNVISDEDGTYAAMPEVQALPTYPNDGAIAVIDGRVIVKLGE